MIKTHKLISRRTLKAAKISTLKAVSEGGNQAEKGDRVMSILIMIVLKKENVIKQSKILNPTSDHSDVSQFTVQFGL